MENIYNVIMTLFLEVWIVCLLLSFVYVIAYWKVFVKAGKPGWITLIPIYNIWTFFKISGLPGWLILIPGVNGIAAFIAYYKLALRFKKTQGFAILSIFFSGITILILAFDKSKYSIQEENVSSDAVMTPPKCSNCGMLIIAGVSICPGCGEKL